MEYGIILLSACLLIALLDFALLKSKLEKYPADVALDQPPTKVDDRSLGKFLLVWFKTKFSGNRSPETRYRILKIRFGLSKILVLLLGGFWLMLVVSMVFER